MILLKSNIFRRYKCIKWWYYWNHGHFNVSMTEKVEHETKKQEGGFLPALLASLVTSLVQSVISSIVKGISES